MARLEPARGLAGRFGLDAFTLVVLVLAATYFALGWTPSSYGTVLDRVGATGLGLVAGEPREIRSDEWARGTPYIQAAVNNDFKRFNATSIYREDLRNFNGLPLADWSLLFKPYFWPFFVIGAPHAFSFYHVFWMALFLVGYNRLFRALRFDASTAALASLALFFTSFVQFWWTTYGSMLAGFPWILVIVMAPLRPWVKAPTLTYVTASWLLAHFYPPMLITLAFVGLVTLVALRRDTLWPSKLLPSIIGTVLGCAVLFFYLRDVIPVMAATEFPGKRVVGGGGVATVQWLAQAFPFLVTSGFHHLVAFNICEAATVGTYLPALWFFFFDPRATFRRLTARDAEGGRLRWALGAVLAGTVLTSLWIVAPLPSVLGRPLLWHLVPGDRMWFAGGFLVFLLALILLRESPLSFSWPRMTGAAAALGLVWYVSAKLLGGDAYGLELEELWILVPLAVVFLFRERIGAALPSALVGCAALVNLVGFGSFNPVQSARPIFDRPETEATAMLSRLAREHPRDWLVLGEPLGQGDRPAVYGAWLNGWGYRSPAHMLYAPRKEFFRSLFPDLEPGYFDWVFNRVMYVELVPGGMPVATGPATIALPLDAFDAANIPVETTLPSDDTFEVAGVIEHRWAIETAGRVESLVFEGWAMLDPTDPASRFRIHSELPITRAVAYPNLRPDVASRLDDPALALSGFTLRLDVAGRVPAAATRSPICVLSEDPRRGSFVLAADPVSPACRALVRSD